MTGLYKAIAQHKCDLCKKDIQSKEYYFYTANNLGMYICMDCAVNMIEKQLDKITDNEISKNIGEDKK